MGCGYMGCGTVVNKISWGVFAALVVLAGVLLGIGLAKVAPCTRALTNCTRTDPAYATDKDVCTVPFRICARSHLIVAGAGVVALLCGVLLLCCMCCCSKPPPPKNVATQPYGNMTGMVQMHGYPTAFPAAATMPMMQQQQYRLQQQQQQLGPQQSYGYTPFVQQGQPGQYRLAEQQMSQQLSQQLSQQASVPVTRY